MTEERDVLSAEEVRRAQMGVSQDAPRWKPVDRLADSHEALRACLDETRRERDDFRSRFELRLEVEALARAVAAEARLEAATDALRPFAQQSNWRSELGVVGLIFQEEAYSEATKASAVIRARAVLAGGDDQA